MKKLYEYRMLIGFIVLVLGVTYLNSLSLKEFIKEENAQPLVIEKLN